MDSISAKKPNISLILKGCGKAAVFFSPLHVHVNLIHEVSPVTCDTNVFVAPLHLKQGGVNAAILRGRT